FTVAGMLTRPDELTDDAVAAAVRTGWGACVDAIEFSPVGFGSHHWLVRGDGLRWFVTADALADRDRGGEGPDGPRARLRAALSTARALYDGGCSFVVAPQLTLEGDVLLDVDDGFVVALYPFVEGELRPWGAYATHAERRAVVERLIEIHA